MRRLRRILRLLLLADSLWLFVAIVEPSTRPAGGVWFPAGLAALGIVLVLLLARLGRYVPARTILELDLAGGVVEHHPDAPFARLSPPPEPALRDVVDALRRAAADPRVTALVARIGGGKPMGPAKVEELRAAVLAFRTAGKRAVAYAESLGMGAPGTLGAWLGAAFDEFWLQPMGDLGFAGLRSESPFLRGLLDRLGVVPRLDHRRDYKAAKYLFTETEMPAAQREETERLLDSILEEVVAGIAECRRLTPERVRALLDEGPFLAAAAGKSGLVDGLRYRDEVYRAVREATRGTFLYLDRYLAKARRPDRKGARVALVYGTGPIEAGRSRFRPFPGGLTMGADDVAGAIRTARKSKKVRAIVFRVDSPGGSATASETIRREVFLAVETGKPVIAVMGDVAASGGYWVSLSATKIVARPTTITGSIGVVWGKFVTAGAFAKLGIGHGAVERGARAGMWSGGRDFTEDEWARLQQWLDEVYAEFTRRVAEARRLSPDEVEEVARGRVWTGRDAAARGLVDVLGGYPEAFALVREALGLAPDAPIRVVVHPRRSAAEQIFRRRENSEDVRRIAAAAGEVVRLVEAAAGPAAGPVRLDPAIERIVR